MSFHTYNGPCLVNTIIMITMFLLANSQTYQIGHQFTLYVGHSLPEGKAEGNGTGMCYKQYITTYYIVVKLSGHLIGTLHLQQYPHTTCRTQNHDTKIVLYSGSPGDIRPNRDDQKPKIID